MVGRPGAVLPLAMHISVLFDALVDALHAALSAAAKPSRLPGVFRCRLRDLAGLGQQQLVNSAAEDRADDVRSRPR